MYEEKEKEIKENGKFVEYLRADYNSQKSFNRKAKVIEYNGALYLQSYDTIVAKIENGEYKIYGWYSETTKRHINDFLMQNGFEALNKKEMMEVI